MRKSQSSIEFALIVGFLLLVFSSLVVAISDKLIEQQNEKNYRAMEELGEVLKMELDFAGNTVEGYERNIFIPDKLNDMEYEVEITSGEENHMDFSIIEIHYTDNENLGDFTTFTYKKISGNIRKGEKNKIVKRGDLVCINKDYDKCT